MNAIATPARGLAFSDRHGAAANDAPGGGTLAARLEAKYPGRVTGSLVLPGQDGEYAPFPDDLPEPLAAALRARGIERLYSHQARAWDATRAGRHLVVATPTASGKSLCYTLPVVASALAERGKALYLFPTKALAQDQVSELLELNAAGDLGLRAATFDGDTPGDARRAIRVSGDIVVSNPDMLHQGILPHHTKWAQFFESLRYVVIDEVHTYRGVFGSHVANVIRRLKRVCAFYGASPTFILCSATIGNAGEHGRALIEAAAEDVEVIEHSGAPRGDRHVLLWNPPVVNPDLGIRASARSQSNRIARLAIRAGLKTLVFCQSRSMVEVLTKYLKEVFDHDPRKPRRIRAYRGGYLPTERRAVEQDMRAGRIDGIVSTSALELGVDIGSLDVVVLNGYPGSISATWQRFGRAGRRQQPSLGVLVASSEALDQYVVRHPEFFAAASPEHARIEPDQPLILLDHIRCAAFELPFRDGDAFGPVEPGPWLEVLAESGVLHHEGERWEWIADSYPAQAVNLRSVADGNFVVVDRTDGRQVIIAEVDYSAAALTLYEGAIHMVQSEPFQVERLDWEGRKAYVRRTQVDYYTDAIDYTKLKVLDDAEQAPAGQGSAHMGEVHVLRRVSGYKKIRFHTHENIGYGPVTLPDQEMHTSALWWQLPQRVLEDAFAMRHEALDGFLGAAHALHLVAQVAVMAESRDLLKAVGSGDGAWFAGRDTKGRGQLRGPQGEVLAGGEAVADASGTPLPGEVGVDGDGIPLPRGGGAMLLPAPGRFTPTIYLYDNYPGGIGLSAPLYERRAELVAQARAVVVGCDCEAGCPACVGPILEADEGGAGTPRALALRVLDLLAAA